MKPERFFKVAKEHPEYAYVTVPAIERYYEATQEPAFRMFLMDTAKDASVENGTASSLFFAWKETGEEQYEKAILEEGKHALECMDDLARVYKVHPFLMAYDTTYAKKEHYAKIVSVFQSMDLAMGWEMVALIDVISVMSPEIYEHYRAMQDLFRRKLKEAAAQIGGFEQFVKEKPIVRAIAGYVILQACENRTLLAEKYQAYGLALWNSVKDVLEETADVQDTQDTKDTVVEENAVTQDNTITEEEAQLVSMVLELKAKVMML